MPLKKCNELNRAERIERLADLIWNRRKYADISKPGVCQFCGHDLPGESQSCDVMCDAAEYYEAERLCRRKRESWMQSRHEPAYSSVSQTDYSQF